MPAKMPLYKPEQLISPEVDVGRLERVFLFATDRNPDICIDISDCYQTKIAAAAAHQSQFPRGEADLEWMKELDQQPGKRIGVPFAEIFKEIRVW
jgi:LmbE family N-acetylglucosaminyl deacetylase